MSVALAPPQQPAASAAPTVVQPATPANPVPAASQAPAGQKPANADQAAFDAAPNGAVVPVSDPANVTAPPAVDQKAQIAALATQFGFDPAQFEGFSDVESATAAVRLFAMNLANAGLSAVGQPQGAPSSAAGGYQVPADPAAPAQPAAVQPLDLKALGLEDDDPAAKAIRALEQQFAQVVQSQRNASELAARIDAMEKAAKEQAQARLKAEASAVVDGFADPRYGVAGNRTPAQKVNLERLYDLADALAIGAYNKGQPIPPVHVRLAQARLIDISQQQPATAVPAVQAPPTQTVAALPQAAPPAAPAVPTVRVNEKWSQNPEIRAKLGL